MRLDRMFLLSAALLLPLAGKAEALVITVGDDEPAADYRTIQEALDVANGAAGFREVRVAAGHYRESLRMSIGGGGGILYLTGGWGPSFATRSFDPAATVVSARRRPPLSTSSRSTTPARW